METDFIEIYNHIRSGRAGFCVQKRGLIAVWGKESIQFLDGLVSNDMKTLEDGCQMLAAFPNAQGRLLALVHVLRQGDTYLFETEEATRQKLYENLFRFTFAGEFFVEDRSEDHVFFEIFGPKDDVFNPGVGERFSGAVAYKLPHGAAYFVPKGLAAEFRAFLADDNGCHAISDELYETLRIENGAPKYGVDMDETTIVPELGLDDLISYTKGCYIGQEIIARIHFRGHVAKQLTGVILSEPPAVAGGLSQSMSTDELASLDGKNAGRVTSVTFSPKLGKTIALAYVRYEYLAEGTKLKVNGRSVKVTNLPFVN